MNKYWLLVQTYKQWANEANDKYDKYILCKMYMNIQQNWHFI